MYFCSVFVKMWFCKILRQFMRTLYFCKLLYMFWAVTPPIIRSTYKFNYSNWHWPNFGKCGVWSQLKMRGMDRTVCGTFRFTTRNMWSRNIINCTQSHLVGQLLTLTYVIILTNLVIRDLVDWKHIQLYTTSTQRPTWRWPCN
jgi:hypothetical protein